MKRILMLLPALALLAGCVSLGGTKSGDGQESDYAKSLKAQAAAQAAYLKDRKPLVQIEANDGAAITGLKKIVVFAPEGGVANVPAPPPSALEKFGNKLLGVIEVIAPWKYGSKMVTGVAAELRTAGTAGYPYVQAPTTTNTMSNSLGTLGSGTYDTTSVPTVIEQPAPVVVQ